MTTINDVIEVYRTGIEKVRGMYNAHYERACSALQRGDAVNYRKSLAAMADLTDRLNEMNKLMAEVEACTM